MTMQNLRLAALFFGPTALGVAAVKGFGPLLLIAGVLMLATLLWLASIGYGLPICVVLAGELLVLGWVLHDFRG